MTGDLISREALMQFPIRWNHYDEENGSKEFISGIETVLEYAQNLPAVDAVPVVHGTRVHRISNGEFPPSKKYVLIYCGASPWSDSDDLYGKFW